ncbi:MAG: ABC transporter substrate-binding protein [Thermomicrobiales bacterium]
MSRCPQRFSRRQFMQSTGVGVGALVLSGVAGITPFGMTAAQDATPAAGTPGGSLVATIVCGDIKGFQTWQDSTACEYEVWSAVFDTLTEYDQEYNLTGAIFESWESPDAKTWTFKVRQGVQWHDGKPLVAQDVIDYFDTVLAPDSGAASNVSGSLTGATYEAPDDATVKLVLAEANAAILDDFTSHWLVRTSDFDEAKPIGTGPFTFGSWERNLQITYAKNPNYWKPGLPYLDELTLRMVPDQDQAINLLVSGEVQAIASVNFPRVAELQANPAVQILDVPEPYRLAFHYLLTKTDAAPWDNPSVRRALNHAVDREALLAATLGLGEIRSNPVAGGSWAFNPDAPSYNTRDLVQAKALMAEAGYAEGAPAFKTTLKYWKEWAQMPQIAQIVQANLADIGIEVELQLLEIGQWVQTVAYDLDYEMALTALVPRWDPSDQIGNAYKTDDGQALLWKNADFDEAFAAGGVTADEAARAEAYFRCQEIALTECPGTVLNGAPIFSAAAAGVTGVIQHNRGYQLFSQASVTS